MDKVAQVEPLSHNIQVYLHDALVEWFNHINVDFSPAEQLTTKVIVVRLNHR